ncbi:MAG: hypothetical protein ACK40K_05580 [Raineya sp.]
MNQKIREAFLKASQNYKDLKNFEQLLQNEQPDKPLFRAYQAACKALYAYYSLVPAMKLSYFLEASQMLSNAIQEVPENIEMRFIRFAMESSLPAAANNYALHLREDKKVIVEQITKSKLQKSFKKVIAQMLVHSGLCTFADKKVLEKYQ